MRNCCLSFAVCCVLRVVCCVLRVGCCAPCCLLVVRLRFAVCWSLSVDWWLLFAGCRVFCLSCVGCGSSFVVRRLRFVVGCLAFMVCRLCVVVLVSVGCCLLFVV